MSSATSQFVRVRNGWGYDANGLGGELTITIDPKQFNARSLGRLIHEHDQNYSQVTLDLSAYTAVDSTSLSLLLELRHTYKSRGVDAFTMVNVQPRVAEMLHLLRVDTCFTVRAA